MMNEELYARPPVVAGMFYPEHEQELRDAVESLMAETAPAPKPGILWVLLCRMPAISIPVALPPAPLRS